MEAADTIHDMLQLVRPVVRILATGWVASAGALIFAAAERENRMSLHNTRFMLHQPLGGVSGPASDVEIEANQIVAMRQRLGEILARATGRTREDIARDTERNHWMTASEAVRYGLVGRLVSDPAEFAAPRSS